MGLDLHLNSCIHDDNQEVEEDDNDQQEVNDGHSVADRGICIIIVIIIAKKFWKFRNWDKSLF